MLTAETIAAIDDGEDIDPVTGEPLKLIRAAFDSGSMVALPDRFEIDECDMMRRFAESQTDLNAANMLLIVIRGGGAFSRFKDAVHQMNLAEAWYEFRKRAYEEIAIEWCREHGIEYYL